VLLGATSNVPGQTGAPLKEYAVKAAFLLNFCRYVEWPENAFAEPGSPLVLGVYGKDPFGPDLHNVVSNQKVGSHPIRVREVKTIGELPEFHLVFFGSSDAKVLPELLRVCTSESVLTVGDTLGFAHAGGCINFFREGQKIRFEINVDAVRQSGLKIRSELLNLARIVRT
jgi:hypothetical protein